MALLAACCQTTKAQGNDFGGILEVEGTHKFSKKLSLDAGAELRLRDNVSEVDRVALSLGAGYKFTKWLRADAGYALLIDNNGDRITYDEDGDENNFVKSYWGMRQRFYAGITGKLDLGRFSFSLRERFQYTYRPEKDSVKVSYSKYAKALEAATLDELVYNKSVKAKNKCLLRSKLTVKYDIPNSNFKPFASCELFTGEGGLQKTRVNVGTEFRISKGNDLKLYYRYQTVNDDDYEGDSHYVGVGYSFRF